MDMKKTALHLGHIGINLCVPAFSFSHPDYTVGPGITPAQPYAHEKPHTGHGLMHTLIV